MMETFYTGNLSAGFVLILGVGALLINSYEKLKSRQMDYFWYLGLSLYAHNEAYCCIFNLYTKC
jgi:hypothetical protein